MLFSSYTFLFLFLPITLVGYYILGRYSWRSSMLWITFASLAFYGWWNPDPSHPWSPQYVFLILLSCIVNYNCGKAISINNKQKIRHSLVVFGVSLNIALLIYFKYLGLFSQWAQVLFGTPISVPAMVLPLAVSFFTFLQIAFLFDVL